MNFSITIFRLIFLLALVLLWKKHVTGQDTTILLNLKNDSALIYRISKISVSGNEKTRENIILREITIKENEVYHIEELGKKIAESKINLLKLPLFNYVSIEISQHASGLADIDVFVEERWFLWPQIAIINNERNFNSWWQQRDLTKLDYRFYLKKYNVLGLNHILHTGISLGFTREYLLGYQNIALDKKQKHLTGFLLSYSWNKYVFFRTFNNKQETFSGEEKENLHEKYLRLD
jgi:outer membrane protein assembly factor BamA